MKSQGFSLLEALVTLVIVTMIMAVLTQALVHVLGIRSRLLSHEVGGRLAVLHEQWFRESVSAALADAEGGLGQFTGDESGFSFMSANALQSAAGAKVAWRLLESGAGQQLEYVEEENATVVIASGLVEARFSYCDQNGRCHQRWPVAEIPGELLPRLVALHAGGDTPWVWWVAITASPRLPPTLEMDFDQLPNSP